MGIESAERIEEYLPPKAKSTRYWLAAKADQLSNLFQLIAIPVAGKVAVINGSG